MLCGSLLRAAVQDIRYVGKVDNSSAAATGITTNIPTGTKNGDLLLFAAQTNPTASWTAPSGWIEVVNTERRCLFYRIWDGAASSYSFTTGVSGAMSSVMLSYQNAGFGSTSSVSSAATNPIAPAFTVNKNNSINLAFVGGPSAGMTYSSSGFTARSELSANATISVFERTAKIGQSDGVAVTFTRLTGANTTRAFQIAIQPRG